MDVCLPMVPCLRADVPQMGKIVKCEFSFMFKCFALE